MAMHHLTIKKLGPISYCEMDCCHFMTLTGIQASGKSTIAKAIYYFRTIKDDIYQLAQRQAMENAKQIDSIEPVTQLRRSLEGILRDKFMRIFGSSWGMDQAMRMEYSFSPGYSVSVSLKKESVYSTPNYIWITLSPDLRDFLNQKDQSLSATTLGVPEEQKKALLKELQDIFDDHETVVYIPAGRSMITLLSQQLSYIYTTMQESQRRTMDYCTQDYIERILRLKPEFSDGLDGLAAFLSARKQLDSKTIKLAKGLIGKVLRGTYCLSGGEERIMFDNSNYVKINFSSSGQQESVWILNLLYYYLLGSDPVLFIIEEPESHLFPESQKFIMELIALVNNSGHSMVITSHSPYVLGALNNLLYAGQFKGTSNEEDASRVIPKSLWLDHKQFGAWFVKSGTIEYCMDPELNLIENERIDEISKTINKEYDQLFDIQYANEYSEGQVQ